MITILNDTDYRKWTGKISQLIILLNKISRLPNNNNMPIDSNLNTLQNASQRMINKCLDSFDELNKVDVLMLLWACHKLKMENSTVLEKCLSFIAEKFDNLSEQDISNYLFCLSKKYEEITSLKDSESIKIKDLAFSHINAIKPKLLSKISQIICKSENEQHLTNVIWAVHKLKLLKIIFSSELQKTFQERRIHFKASNFRIIVNSLTELSNSEANDLFETFSKDFIKRLDTFTLEEVLSLITAFHLSQSINMIVMLNNIQGYLSRNLTKFSNEQLVSLLIPYTMVFESHTIIEAIIDRLEQSICMLPVSNLIKIFWALTLSNDIKKINTLLQIYKVISKKDLDTLRVVDLSQYAQGLLSLSLNLDDSNSKKAEIKRQYNNIKSILQQELSIQIHKGFSHYEFGVFSIFKTLQESSLRVVPEFIIEIYNIDFALLNVDIDILNSVERDLKFGKLKIGNLMNSEIKIDRLNSPSDFKHDINRTILIEVNGNSHYIGETAQLNRKTILKENLLDKLGYTLVSLSRLDCARIELIDSPNERALALINIIKEGMRN